ncbi:MAG: hypothetical protein IJ331_02370, partial [Ruminococcus sp.]|nr:hypothetical protein [Ruminococcus sp.]
MKAKRLLSLLLAIVMVISLVTVTAITTTAANTMEIADTSATYNYQANSMYQLEMYLKIAGNCKIKLTGDCLCSHELGSEGHTPTQVYGIKTIDLNGYDIICKDESNATKVKHNHTFITGECTASNLGKGTGVMMNVNSGSILTIEDSSNGEGRIHYDGRTIGYTAGPYASDMHYLGYAKRDVFEVEGTLILNDGAIEAGREEKYYFSDSRTESGGTFNANAYEQIKGTAVKVLNGGKFVVNGGTVRGLGMATTSYEEINAIEINSEGEVFVNDGKISALGGANIFGGEGVDGGLHIAAGIFAIDKRDKIRINDVQGGYFTSPVSAYLYYPRVTNGKYGVMGIPDSAWKNQLGHKRVEVHELESDKYYTYTGWKDSDFAIDFSGNYYKEIAICGRSTYNTDAVFLQATYGSTALGNKSVLVYYPDTADKFRVTYDYASDPYFKYGNTTLKYDWKIWHTVKDDTPDFQMTNTSA